MLSRLSVYLYTIETLDNCNYNSDGFKESASDLFVYLKNDLLNTLDSKN